MPVRFRFGCMDLACTGEFGLSGNHLPDLVTGVPWVCPACNKLQLARLDLPVSVMEDIDWRPVEVVPVNVPPPAGQPAPRSPRRGWRR